jgi:hypothetical protein
MDSPEAVEVWVAQLCQRFAQGPTKMRLNLGGVGRNGADVCNVVAFFE